MRRVDSIVELAGEERVLHLALGVFDGVHLGHQAVIGAAVRKAREAGGIAGVLTFEPHPIQVLAPERAPRRILASLAHKERLLAELGVSMLVVIPFTPRFAKREALEFAEELFAIPALTMVSVGEDWKFGRGRQGSLRLLQQLGEEQEVEVVPADCVMLDGERVSSTRIRQALRDGNLHGAAAMLGRPYSVMGCVQRGQQLGRELGVPTANIAAGSEQLPPNGVYAATVRVGETWMPGIANLGVRPTVGGEARVLEAHLFDFEGDLYEQEVEVRFGELLRGEKKFANLEALRRQILADVKEARRRVSNPSN